LQEMTDLLLNMLGFLTGCGLMQVSGHVRTACLISVLLYLDKGKWEISRGKDGIYTLPNKIECFMWNIRVDGKRRKNPGLLTVHLTISNAYIQCKGIRLNVPPNPPKEIGYTK
jgi:hypothetical protein